MARARVASESIRAAAGTVDRSICIVSIRTWQKNECRDSFSLTTGGMYSRAIVLHLAPDAGSKTDTDAEMRALSLVMYE